MSVQISGSQIKNDAINNSKIADNAVQSDQIQDNAVISDKIASGAITEAKLGASSVTTTKISNSAVTSDKIDFSGTFDFSPGTLRAGTPSNDSDVTPKSYVDGLVGAGVFWKEPARVASTANVNISNPGTSSFDGITLSGGDRILLKNQSSNSENGVYDFNGPSSALTRSSDANSADELNGLAIFIKEGTDNADQGYYQSSEISSLGSSPVTFVQFTGLGQITAGNGLTKTGNRLDVAVGNGIQISADAVVFRAGAGLDFGGSDVDVQVDDSSIEINGSGNLQVKANGITSAMIGTNQVTGSEIAGQTISSANLADSCVTANQIGASAVTEAKINSNAVSSAKIANNAVTADKISSAVAGSGLLGGAGSALSVNCGNGLDFNGDAVDVQLGAGLEFQGGNIDVEVDDSTVEVDGVSNELRVKDFGITSGKLANSAVSTTKIANDAVTAAKVGFQAYQELTTVSGGSTLSIDLAREVDAAFSNGILAFKNGLALLNQTALGGSASNSDEFTLSVVGGVTRLSFGAALSDADSILIVYMA